MTDIEWLPITRAPMDGRPVWVRGNNYGQEAGGQHYCWAFWDGAQWVAAGTDGSTLLYLTHYMKDSRNG